MAQLGTVRHDGLDLVCSLMGWRSWVQMASTVEEVTWILTSNIIGLKSDFTMNIKTSSCEL
jgi:hypothetical protein